MKFHLHLLTILLLASMAALAAPETPASPLLIQPAEGAALMMSVPHFQWREGPAPNVEAMPASDIQIAADADFKRIVDEDRLAAVIGWYVPDKELAPGAYWWRVGAVDARGRRGPWSPERRFTVHQPERVVKIPRNSTFAGIQSRLAEAAKQTPALVQFEPGSYRLDPGRATVFIAFTNAIDLVVDGGGASIVFTRPLALAHLERGRRVLIKNFTFDFDPPAYTAGRVASLDLKAGTMEAEILPGHALPDAWPAFSRDTKGMITTEAEGFAMKRGIQLVVAHAGFERMEGRRFRFRFDKARTAGLFSVGDIYVLDPRWIADAGGHGTAVNGGEDVVFLNLTIHSAANECLGSFYADRHAILHVRLERPAGRALSVNNGGNNHHNARTGPWIEGCLFENCGDDVCHVNGYAMAAASQPAPDSLVINLHQPYDQFGREARLDFRDGDRLLFYEEKTGRLLAERRVAGVTPQEKTTQVRLDRPLDGIKTGKLLPSKQANYAVLDDTAVTQIFNASRMCNQFVFRNNVARNSRRIGVLAKGNGGLIEGNLFENLGGGGVEFWNAPFEGLAAENYVVRDNRILNCGRLARKHAAIWATMFKTGGDQLHRNLLIERNEIAGFPPPAILLHDATNVVLRGNRITVASEAFEPVVFSNTSAVRRQSNTVAKPKP